MMTLPVTSQLIPRMTSRTVREPFYAEPMSIGLRRPLVIAHRGSSAVAPEHTLAAYQQAIVDAADGWECDVRLTADGHLVCFHDRRVNRTSNGKGSVSAYRLAELRALQRDSHPVLTLAELLEFFVAAPGAPQLLIETKHPTRHAGAVEETLVALLRRFGLYADPPSKPRANNGAAVPLASRARVLAMSMWPGALRRLRTLAPGLATVQLTVAVPPPYRDGRLPGDAPVAGPAIRVLRAFPDYVRRAKNAGKQVYCWTVDELSDVDLMVELGVDGIITNRPAAVLARLTGSAAEPPSPEHTKSSLPPSTE